MSSLSIHRLTAEVSGSQPESRVRVDRLLHRLADSALDERRAGWHGLTGHWCVRRLRLLVELDETEPDASVVSRWADAIAASVRELVPDGSRVVHYPNRAHAVHEVVESLAQRVAERSWAWQQLGLLGEQDPDPGEEPGRALVAVARREPALVLASLARTARRGRLPALHRVLGEAGWVALAEVIQAGAAPWRPDPTSADTLAPVRPDVVAPWEEADVTWPRLTPAVRARAAAVLADSELTRAVLASGIVPSEATFAAWATLSVAGADPHGPGLRPAVAHLLRRRLLPPVASSQSRDLGPVHSRPSPRDVAANPDSAMPTGPGASAPAEHGEEPGTRPTDAEQGVTPGLGGDVAREDHTAHEPGSAAFCEDRPQAVGTTAAHAAPDHEDDEDAEDHERREGQPTEWAGLLFLLNTAGLAGIPDDLDGDPRLAARSLRWSLHQLALRLVPVAATDPAALALAGISADHGPGRSAVPSGDPHCDEEDVALAGHAGRWAEETRAVLRAAAGAAGDGSPAPTLWSVTRRPGRVVADPGWLEVHLDLDAVDVHVRRAGLDVDPGWVPWLGTVVRFRYV